jgi:hypothetical protein
MDTSVTRSDWEPLFWYSIVEALKADCKLLQTIRNSLLDLDANLIPSKYEDIKTAIQQMGLEYDENTYFKQI